MGRSQAARLTARHGNYVQLESLASMRAGIDISCWMYYAMTLDRLRFPGDTSGSVAKLERLVSTVTNRLEMLTSAGIEPWLVYDGEVLPGKQAELNSRVASRQKAASELELYLADGGKPDSAKALKLEGRAEGRSAELTNAVKCRASELGYHQITAPYEADAQLKFLYIVCIIDLVVTGDADLQVLGVGVVAYDMASRRISTGAGVYVIRERDVMENRHATSDPTAAADTADGSLYCTSDEEEEGENDHASEVLDYCRSYSCFADAYQPLVAVAGCDYNPGLHGVGIVTAARALASIGGGGLPSAAEICAAVRGADETALLLQDKRNSWFSEVTIQQTLDLFRHQVVWDPAAERRTCMLGNQCNCDHGNMPHCGTLEHEQAADLASGRVCSFDGQAVDIPDAGCRPNFGWCKGDPRYVGITTTAMRSALPPLPMLTTVRATRNAPASAYQLSQNETAAVDSVISQLGEGHKVPSEPVDRALLAHKLLDTRDRYSYPEILGSASMASFQRLLPEISTFEEAVGLPAEGREAEATREQLFEFLRMFQGLVIPASGFYKEDAVALVQDVRQLMKDPTNNWPPRLRMSPEDLMVGSSKGPDPNLFDKLHNKAGLLRPEAEDGEWDHDIESIGLQMCELSIAQVEAQWTTVEDIDGLAKDDRTALQRAHRLLHDATDMPHFRALFFKRQKDNYVWIGYRSLASLRGSHKDADADAQANYWAFVCLELNPERRIVVGICACICECVAGLGDCSHCAALCLALVSFQLLERTRSGGVRNYKVVPHTQFSKSWSGDGECNTDLTVPARLMPIVASHYGHDAEGAGTENKVKNPKPEWILEGEALESVTTTNFDTGDSHDRLIRALRRDALHSYNHTASSSSSRRKKGGRTNRKTKVDVPGQLAYDEVLGGDNAGLEHRYTHAMDETLWPLLPEFEGTPAGLALESFRQEQQSMIDDWNEAVNDPRDTGRDGNDAGYSDWSTEEEYDAASQAEYGSATESEP